MFRQIGAYDAKTKLPELLRLVQEGQRFTITHRGQPVADLVPSTDGDFASADAVDDMLAFEQVTGVKDEDVSAWVTEGRR